MLISAYLYFEFLIAFLSLRRRWYMTLLRFTAPVLLGCGPALLLMGRAPQGIGSYSDGVGHSRCGTVLWIMGWLLFIFSTLIVATLRRNFEAGLLLIPLVLSLVGIVEPMSPRA